MAEYIRQPYVPDQRTMLELMRLAAEDRSRSDLQRAQLRSQGVMNIGELIAGTLASFRQDRERQDAGRVAQQRQEQEDAFKRRDQQLREADLIARIGEREQTTARQRELDQRQATMDAQKAGDARAKAIGYGPMAEMDVDTVMQSPERAGDVRYIFGPGTADGPELMPTREQQRGIQVEKDIAAMGGKIGPNGQVVMPPKPERENFNEDTLVMMAARGDKMAQRALEIKRGLRGSDAQERSVVAVLDPVTGKPKYVRPSDAVGLPPASNREQGRPVTSGDAGRLADLDTSLDDLGTLASTLQETKNATGVKAQAGAALWQPITDITGWGIDAKKRQGVIDRVKQVIGKALEGGVLRKEDEVKYAKILPTISDTPEVAASKLTGLRDALVQRRQTTLDALSDAGYDVSRFNARAPKDAPKASDRVDELIKKYGGG